MSLASDWEAIRNASKTAWQVLQVPMQIQWGAQFKHGVNLSGGNATFEQRAAIKAQGRIIQDILVNYVGGSLDEECVFIRWGEGISGQPPVPAAPLPPQFPYPPPIFTPPLPPTTPPTANDYIWTV